ncbi:MFS transporter [bacterium]|nr:MFS transporter [bacterium]
MINSKQKLRIRNATILTGSTMTVMAGATIAPALPSMHTYFQNIPQVELLIKLVLTLPALFIALASLLMGLILDRWGRKPVLMFGLCLYGVAGSAGLYLDSLTLLLVSRALLGVAVAAIMTACTTLIGDYFPGDKLLRFMGLQASFMGFGGVLFLALGGVLTDIGWRYPFLVYLLAFIVLGFAGYSVSEPDRRLETSTSGVTGADNPPQLFLVKISGVYLIVCVGMIAFYMFPVQIPFYLQSIDPVSSSTVGLVMSTMNLMFAVVAMSYQRLRVVFSSSAIFILSACFLGGGFWTVGQSLSYLQVMVGLMIAGIGMGLLMPNLNVLLLTNLPGHIRGRVVGGFSTFAFLGQFLSPVAVTLLSYPFTTAQTFQFFGVLAAGLALVSLSGIVIYRFSKR